MTLHHPPRLATWFLKRLGSTSIEDALVGDLFEEYQKRRSAPRYWKQVIVAIGLAARRDVRQHVSVAFVSIVSGLSIVSVPILVMIVVPAKVLSHVAWLQTVGSGIVTPMPFWVRILAAFIFVFGSAGLSGLLVSALFPSHRAAAVLSLALAIVAVGVIVLSNAADLGPVALTFLLVFEVVSTVGGGLLIGARERPNKDTPVG